MLIGMGNNAKKPTTAANADIFDVTSANFETTALKESLNRPVLVEFWAPWCGPCKQLMPMLEQLVAGRDGQIALAKVNIDENPELAQAFRVQSVPTVVALYQGQPVTAFAGVRPQSDIEKLADQLLSLHRQSQPEALDIPAALKDAADLLAAGEIDAAHGLYARIIEEDANNIEALVGRIRVAIVAGHLPAAEALIAEMPVALQKDSRVAAVKTAYQLAVDAPQGDIATAEAKVASNPKDCQALFDLAGLYHAQGFKEQAVDALMSVLRVDRAWEDEKAKKQLLTYLEAWGFADPVSVQARRKLSALLFS